MNEQQIEFIKGIAAAKTEDDVKQVISGVIKDMDDRQLALFALDLAELAKRMPNSKIIQWAWFETDSIIVDRVFAELADTLDVDPKLREWLGV